MTTHRYHSGVGFDSAPGDPIYPCCDLPASDPVHNVACDRCGRRATSRHECPRRPTP